MIYIVKLCDENESFIKLGYSSNIGNRLKQLRKFYHVDLLTTKQLPAPICHSVEKEFHRYTEIPKYIPLKRFKGERECYALSDIKLVEHSFDVVAFKRVSEYEVFESEQLDNTNYTQEQHSFMKRLAFGKNINQTYLSSLVKRFDMEKGYLKELLLSLKGLDIKIATHNEYVTLGNFHLLNPEKWVIPLTEDEVRECKYKRSKGTL